MPRAFVGIIVAVMLLATFLLSVHEGYHEKDGAMSEQSRARVFWHLAWSWLRRFISVASLLATIPAWYFFGWDAAIFFLVLGWFFAWLNERPSS